MAAPLFAGIAQLKRFLFRGRAAPLTFGAAAFLILLFAYFNPEFVFGTENAARALKVIQAYLILALVSLSIFNVRPDIFRQNFSTGFKDFALFSLGSFVIVLVLPFLFASIPLVPAALQTTNGIFDAIIHFAVAVVETLSFTGIIATAIPFGNVIAPLAAAIFHITVLQGSLILMALVFAF